MKCPKCNYNYRIPEDEETCSYHPCPNCGEDGRRWFDVSITLKITLKGINEKDATMLALEEIFNGDLKDGSYKFTVNSVEEVEG